ncbi:MAG: ribosomal protein S19 family protein [Candidatus Micrarchaeaceae archaeon]
MPERIVFKGVSESQVAKMDMQEFIKLINARERRWIKRNSMQYRKLIEKVDKAKKLNIGKAIRTQTREAVILPSWLNMKFELYNGKEFTPLTITPNMVGHRLGEFVYTTKRVQHSAPGIRATRGSKFLAQK